jgi:photosystem II stability/assembly factor-like uncharacterized protein
MRAFLLLTFLLCFFYVSNAQQAAVSIPGDADRYPYWIDWMQEDDVNYFKAKRAFEVYIESNDINSGWKPFARWLSDNEHKVDYRDGSLPDPKEVKDAFIAYRQMNGARSANGNWKELGPAFSDYTIYGDIYGVGRLNAIAFHPTDTNTIYVGAPAGGLWMTTDGGASWTSTTDELPSLGVSAICVHPTNPDLIYIGTGDRDANDAPGQGVWLSTDGGQTWSASDSGMGDVKVGAMLIHPYGPDTLIAATDDGIFRSEDAGASWVKTSTVNLFYKDLQFKPYDPRIVYAEARGRFFRSDDNGKTWTQITNGILLGYRQVIGVSKADPNRVYVLQSYQREFRALYRSDDAGLSFYQVTDSPNILGRAADGSDDEGQSWYDLCIEVDPTDADILYSGGINMWRSDDGGQTWSINGHRSDVPTSRMHVDQHDYAFHPITNKLYVGNDGGIYVSPTGNNGYRSISEDMGIGQIYRLGASYNNERLVLTGFQDNGTSFFDGSKWNRTTGADGFECFYDPTDDNYRYTSIYYGDVYRSVNNTQPHKIAGNDVNDIDETGNWITPFELAKHNPNTMSIGYYSIWRSDNVKTEKHGDVEWRNISGPIGISNSAFNVIDHSPVDSNVLYCSKGVWLWRGENVLDSVPTWVQLNPPTTAFSVADILCHPRSVDTIYIVQGSRVYRSADTGSSWSDISGTLPDIPMNTIVFDLTSREGLYVAGDAGVYYYDDVQMDWVPFFNGLPANVPVRELEVFYGSNSAEHRIRAATYGRGLWESDLIGSNNSNFPPVAAIRAVDPQILYHEGTKIEFSFFRGVEQVSMSGFDVSDVTISNATLSNFSGGPYVWTADVNPTSRGTITIMVPSSIAQDQQGLGNVYSDTFRMTYEGVPDPVGISGPGGIGDGKTLALWLRADTGLYTEENGSEENTEGARVGYWLDLSGKQIAAEQSDTALMPSLRLSKVGGQPGVEFKPDTNTGKQFMIAKGVVPGVDFTALTIAQSNTTQYNDHNWISSARMNSGFNLHVTKDSKYWYPVVVDGVNSNLSRDHINLDDITIPHIFGVTFDQTEVRHQYVAIADQEDLEQRPPTYFIPRRNSDTIEIKYGWDFKQRYGDGLVSEAIVLNRRIYSSHSNILRNYFNARYGIDIGNKDFYAHDANHALDVAGIGRESFYDMHLDAKGPGLVRFRRAYDLGDGEYMIWGHDGAGTGQWMNQNVPTGLERIDRSWRLDKTGVIGKAEVVVLANDLPSSIDPIGILVAEDAGFTQGVYALPFTVDGDTLKATLFMPDDAFFTFVTGPESAFQQYTSVENLKDVQFVVYPNPTESHIKVASMGDFTGSDDLSLQLYDMTGRLLMQMSLEGNKEAVVDLSSFATGTYHVEVVGQHYHWSQKVIKH